MFIKFLPVKRRAKAAGIPATKEYKDFLEREACWLEDYALYMAIKDRYDGKSWDQWEDNIRLREELGLADV